MLVLHAGLWHRAGAERPAVMCARHEWPGMTHRSNPLPPTCITLNTNARPTSPCGAYAVICAARAGQPIGAHALAPGFDTLLAGNGRFYVRKVQSMVRVKQLSPVYDHTAEDPVR